MPNSSPSDLCCDRCQHYKLFDIPYLRGPEDWAWDCVIEETDPIPLLREKVLSQPHVDYYEALATVAADCPYFSQKQGAANA